MHKKINIYQAFVRLFGNCNTTNQPNGNIQTNGCGKLQDFNEQALAAIAQLGCNYIWYTGVIQHASKTSYEEENIPHCNPFLVKGEAGSPYAISDYYRIHADLLQDPADTTSEFSQLVDRSHQAGLKVIIDFVPNHVARQYHSLNQPLGVANLGSNDHSEYAFHAQNNFYYIPNEAFQPQIGISMEEIGYHEFPAKATGNDCFHAHPNIYDWYETIKINYGVNYSNGATYFDPIPDTWTKMLDILLFWCERGVDGFRCDMVHMVPIEYWHWAIEKVKAQYPEVIFIGELYEQRLYRPYLEYGGFDFLYDKVGLYDTLRNIIQHGDTTRKITSIWQQNEGIQHRMLHFMENHDEQRIASSLFANHACQGIPAMMVSAWINSNATMIYFGQELGETGMCSEGFSGMDGRTSIFDYWGLEKMTRFNNKGQWNEEQLMDHERKLKMHYQKILTIARNEAAMTKGAFFDLMYANQDYEHFCGNRLYCFLRKHERELLVVVINFDTQTKYCQINIPKHAFDVLGITTDYYPYCELVENTHGFLQLNPDTPLQTEVPGLYGKVYKFEINPLNQEKI